jgi:hypothetical protein
MKKGGRLKRFGSFGLLAVEVAIYAVLVAGYLLLVVRFLSPFLQHAFQDRRILYSALAVLLMLGQGFLLELLTTLLVRLFARARRLEGRPTLGLP